MNQSGSAAKSGHCFMTLEEKSGHCFMTLEELLNLKYDDFFKSLFLYSNYKLLIRNFEKNKFVKELDKIISNLSLEETSSKVNGVLNSLLTKYFKPGYVFEYNEFIMALLFVLKNRHPKVFTKISEELIKTNSAELGSARRFAKEILNNE